MDLAVTASLLDRIWCLRNFILRQADVPSAPPFLWPLHLAKRASAHKFSRPATAISLGSTVKQTVPDILLQLNFDLGKSFELLHCTSIQLIDMQPQLTYACPEPGCFGVMLTSHQQL